MKLFGWLDTTESDAFAREIADEFAHNAPAARLRESPKDAEQRLAHAIEVIGNRASKFQSAKGLGWYRKSRFMNTIKACLIEKGHPPELADRVVYAIVLRTAAHRMA